jgi:hypothetical protein
VRILLDRGWTPYDILTKALVGGMTIVGNDFRDGILFVPEVLMAANAMKGGMAILKPLLVETGAPRIGKMVIGTVKGDIHDIGKNLVSMMMEGAGFEVVDLGINNAVEKYLEALETEAARYPRHVGAPDHDDALHEGRDRHDERKGHPRRLHRAGGRRAAERGIRSRHRRRRLLPGRRRGSGNGRGVSETAKEFVGGASTTVRWPRAPTPRRPPRIELPAATPRLRLGLWLVIGFAYGMLAIGWSDRVFPWLEPPSPTLDPATLGALEGGVILPLLLGCALIALIYGTVALSVYAIHITAMNYPAVSAVLKFAAVVEAVWEDRKEAKTGQTTAPAPAAKVTDGDPAVVQSMLDLIPEAWKAMTPRTGILPVESGMTPRQIVDDDLPKSGADPGWRIERGTEAEQGP